jgi:outer membrane protein assembly factor BamB
MSDGGSTGEVERAAPRDVVQHGRDLHERSLVRAARAATRWVNPGGGVAWRLDLRLASYRPSVVGDDSVVVWPGRPAAWGTAYDRLLALDPVTGEPRWEHDLAELAAGAPLEPGEHAAVAWERFVIVALQRSDGAGVEVVGIGAGDGRSRWRVTIPGMLEGPMSAPGGGLVILASSGGAPHDAGAGTGPRRVVAVDVATGVERWSRAYPTRRDGAGSAPRDGGLVVPLLGNWDGVHDIWGCDPATGEVAWVRTSAELLGQPSLEGRGSRLWARAVAGPGVVVLSCIVDDFPAEGRWPVSESVLSELDLVTGFVRWNARWHRKLGDVVGVGRDVVVVHHGDGFEALDRDSGVRRWLARAPIDLYFLKPVLVGRLLLHRDNGDLVVRDVESGSVVWSTSVGIEERPGQDDAPIVVGQRVLCRVNGELVAIDLPQHLRPLLSD